MRVEIFTTNPFHARLKTHKLSGKLKGMWAFSIEQDARVLFYFTKDKPRKAVFTDIGSHDEVY
jgi:mRNA-degrading endonuclease YafQ of YafQ-DinJ toxin-antitoxin module